MAFLLIGLAMVLFVAATDGRYVVWILWIAVPMLMFSLAYLLLVSATPILLWHVRDGDSEQEQPQEDRKE